MSDFTDRRDARNAEGKCANCNRDREPGFAYCIVCAEAHRRTIKKARQRRKELGLCRHCGKPPRPHKALCAECAKKNGKRMSEYQKRRREKERVA